MGYVYYHPFKFPTILSFSNVFINIHEYANEKICISYFSVKVVCLNLYLVTSLVVLNS